MKKYKERKLQDGKIKTMMELAVENGGYIYQSTCFDICNTRACYYNLSKQMKDKGFIETIRIGTDKKRKAISVKPKIFKQLGYETPRSRNSNDVQKVERKCKMCQTMYNARLADIDYEAMEKDETTASARAHGILSKDDKYFISYNFGLHNLVYQVTTEERAKRRICRQHNLKTIDALLFVDDYEACNIFIKNEEKNQKNLKRGMSRINLLLSVDFTYAHIVLNGKAGTDILKHIFGENPQMEERIDEIMRSLNPIPGKIGIGDGECSKGIIYNMVKMDLHKLVFLSKRKEDKKVIICTEAQKNYLETITEGIFEVV